MTIVSNEELASFFHDLNFRLDTVAELNLHLANRFSVFRWLAPDELKLSSIIRELLDPSGVHGQGDAFLRIFLDMVGKMAGLGRLAIDRHAPRPKCEESTRNAANPLRRIDIFLRPTTGCAIGIENKPWAADQPGWVKDYSDHLAECGDSYVLIYLTTDGSDPSGDDDQKAAGDLGCRFLKISYKQHIKGWLEDCCQACRADKVRTFLRDFIDYVNAMEETGMRSEQDLALVMNYVRDQPGDKGFRIAYLMNDVWPEVVRRVASDFLAALEERLRTEFGDEWKITRDSDSNLLKADQPSFKASKRQWQRRFAFQLGWEIRGFTDAYFGIAKGEDSDPYIPNLKARMDEGMGAGKQNRWWEYYNYVDPLYRYPNTPETLLKLREKGEALNYYADLFGKMRQIAEPFIDDACSSS
jgi:hypothetical protein